MLLLRKIVFYVFLLAYVVICPVLLLYALGYIFKPDTAEYIVKTGDIHLATLPDGATVYINKKVFQDKTPALIDKLLPGNYDVAMFLEGYDIWRDTLPVKAGKATVLDKILLVPKKRTSKTILTGNYEAIIPLKGANLFLISKSSSLGDYFDYSYKSDEISSVLEKTSPYRDYKIISYFKSKGCESILFNVSSGKDEKFLWIDFGNQKNPVIEDITDLFQEKPERVLWDPGDETNIFTFQSSHINRINLEKKALFPDYIKNVRGFGIKNETLYVLSNDKSIFSTDYDKKNIKYILSDENLGNSLFGSSGYFKILPFVKNILLFVGDKGELLSNHLPYKFIDSGLVELKFFEDEEEVLVCTKDKIGILDFSTEATGDIEFEKAPELLWVFTKGNNIRDAEWAYDDSHILFRDENIFYLLEANEYTGPRLSKIVNVKAKSKVFYSDDLGELYYIDPGSGNLLMTDIVPKKDEETEK